MSIHHQAALDMVRHYRADPAARNGFLGWLNGGIATDQAQEIALMRAVVRRFPGDPDAVQVDPSMIHGMEGHGAAHGTTGAHGGHAADAASAAPAAAETPHAHQQHRAPAQQPARQRRERRPDTHHHHH
jgi:uncharacterized protein (DUF305 family)